MSFNTPSAGSFVFLGETTASNVATVDLNGYFSSSYDIYEIYLDGVYGSNNLDTLYMRVATTGSYTVDTGSNYCFACVYSTFAGVSNEGSSSNSLLRINQQLSNTSSNGGAYKITLYNPNSTSYYKVITTNFANGGGNISDYNSGAGGGTYKSTTAITGLRFFCGVGNIYARKIKIYGVKNT